MTTPVCPRLLNLNNDFVLLRFWARAPEDLSAIEVIYIIIIMFKVEKSCANGDSVTLEFMKGYHAFRTPEMYSYIILTLRTVS